MTGPNILVISSDQQRWDALGVASSFVHTPHLDRLAGQGVRFTQGFCAAPICVPTRAAMATGLPVSATGCWSSAQPYHGHIPTWHHMLRDLGYRTASVGKLHFRSSDDDNGFVDEINPVHVINGIGHPYCILRDPPAPLEDPGDFVRDVGWGESGYTRYDRGVADAATDWLSRAGDRAGDKAGDNGGGPFGLFVSFAAPHYPLVAPEAYQPLYPPEKVPLPNPYVPPPDVHPVVANHPIALGMHNVQPYSPLMRDADHVRALRAYYYGLVSFLDDNVGKVLSALDTAGLAENTLVLFVSDHGEMLGDLGLWTKGQMFEASVRVPFLMRGPGLAQGVIRDTPVGHTDIYATIARAVGVTPDGGRTGRALQDLVEAEDPDRAVLIEYHDHGAVTGMTGLRWDRWKYVHYAGYRPMLFDLVADPAEETDLATDPGFADVLADCDAKLRSMVDPDETNARAFTDQRARIEELGGEAYLRSLPQMHYTPMD